MEVGRSIFRAIADFSGIRREARRTANDLEKMDKVVGIAGNLAGSKFAGGFIRGMLKLSAIAPIIGAVGAAGLSGAANLLTLASSMTAVLGLGVAAPAVLGGFAVATLALGLALKDAKKYLGDLAPAMQAVQQSVSSNFWYGASKPIHEMVKTLLPAFKDGLENVGTAWGTVAAAGANAMKVALKDGPLKSMLEGVRAGVAGLAPAMWPIVHSLTTLGVTGTKYLPQMSAWVVGLTQQFDRFIEKASQTGKLDAWLKGGVGALKDVWSIAKSALGVVGALTKAAQASGANSTLTTLAGGLEKISTLMNGPTFQTALTTIFTGANKGADALLKALGPIGDAFVRGAPALASFLELGGQILGLVVGGLADAISNPAFGAGLVAFMEGVKVGAAALAPLLPVISTAFGALLTAMAPVMAVLLPALAVTVAELAGAFAAVITALSPVLVVLAAMSPVLIPLALAFFGIYKALMLFSQIKEIIVLLREITVVQWLWNVALSANPIGLIIIAVIALVAALVWFFTQTDLGREIWGGFVNWLGEIIGGFLNWWNGTAVPWLQMGFTAMMAIVTWFVGMWNAGWTAVWNWIMSVVAWIGSLIDGWVSNTMATLAILGTLGALAWGWFMGMVTSALDAGGQLLAWVGSLPGQVLGMLGDLGGLLLGAGQSLIQGFIDGIQGMIGAVGDAVGGVMDFVGSFFPHSPAKRGEFSGRGWTPYRGQALMTGFADGIAAGQQSGVQAAGDATLAISNQLNPTISPLNALGGVPAGAVAPQMAQAVPGKLNPNAGSGEGKGLSVTVVNPAPEPPSQSIQKTYSRIAYLGLDAKETVGV